MKIPTATVLCALLPKVTEGMISKIPSSKNVSPVFDMERTDSTSTSAAATAAADVSRTVEDGKTLLITVPNENDKTNDLDAVASPEGAHTLEQAAYPKRGLTSMKKTFASIMGATSLTQWTMLLSSMAPISLIEKVVGAVGSKSFSLDQHDIFRTVLQEYQVIARVAVVSMSLPTQFISAIWIAYVAMKAFPQRSLILSLLLSAAVHFRASELPGRLSGQDFMNMAEPYRSQIPVFLIGMSLLTLLPMFVSGARSVGIFGNSITKSPFVLSDCLLTPEDFITTVDTKPIVQPDATELRTSLASVPLNRLIALPSADHNNWKESRYTVYTKPAVELWRIGTSVQFWKSIYHAVKQDEYYILVDNEREPLAIA